MFNQLASWLFSTSKTDTRARFHRVEKAAGPVPSCSFERSFGLYRRCCLPGGRFGRRGVRAARRLRDFTGCDFEFVRFLSVRCTTKKSFWNSNSTRAERKRFLSPKHARPSRRRRREIHPNSQTKKRRCPTTIARAPLIFLSRCSSTPSRRRFRYLDLYTVVQKTGGECVCVWISVKISPFATPVFFYPQSIA